MSGQTTVIDQAVAFAGNPANKLGLQIEHRRAGEALPEAGLWVGRGSGDDADEITLPDAQGEVDAHERGGIVMFSATERDASGNLYSEDDPVPVILAGDVWVEVEDAVTAGGDVFVRVTAGGGEQQGAFRSDGDGGDAFALPNATYITSAGIGGLAIVRLKPATK